MNYEIHLANQVFNCSTLPPGYETSGATCNRDLGICASPTSSMSPSRTPSQTLSLTTSSAPSGSPSESSTQLAAIYPTPSSYPSRAGQTTAPSPTDSLATQFSFSVAVLVASVVMISMMCCLIAWVIAGLLWRRSLKSRTDGYEPFLPLTLPELENVSSFLSNPDVPLIAYGELEVGRSIGKGTSGVVRCGVWRTS